MLVRFLAGTLAGAIVFFLGGWLIYGLLLRSYFESTMTATARSVMSPEPNFLPLILAQIVFGALFTFIFVYWASISTLVGGMRAGAIIMFALALGWDLQMAAFFKDMHVGSPVVPVIVDVIAATVLGALAGGAIGQAVGMVKTD
jgi:hypothetical protein